MESGACRPNQSDMNENPVFLFWPWDRPEVSSMSPQYGRKEGSSFEEDRFYGCLVDHSDSGGVHLWWDQWMDHCHFVGPLRLYELEHGGPVSRQFSLKVVVRKVLSTKRYR